MMESRKDRVELSAIANLLRCDKIEGPAKLKDQVMIDYLGRLHDKDGNPGELFEGGYGLGYVVELGSASLVPGFEEQIVGCKIGDVKNIEVTFPENYPKDLKEKTATFNIKVLGIWRQTDEHRVIEVLYTDLKKAEEEALAKKKAETEATKETK